VFTPWSEAASLTRASHLHRNATPVTVRSSDFAGIPSVADNDPQGAGPRRFAVRFHLGEHVHTNIIGHLVDAFSARTAEGLVEFLNALGFE
jgi:catalase